MSTAWWARPDHSRRSSHLGARALSPCPGKSSGSRVLSGSGHRPLSEVRVAGGGGTVRAGYERKSRPGRQELRSAMGNQGNSVRSSGFGQPIKSARRGLGARRRSSRRNGLLRFPGGTSRFRRQRRLGLDVRVAGGVSARLGWRRLGWGRRSRRCGGFGGLAGGLGLHSRHGGSWAPSPRRQGGKGFLWA